MFLAMQPRFRCRIHRGPGSSLVAPSKAVKTDRGVHAALHPRAGCLVGQRSLPISNSSHDPDPSFNVRLAIARWIGAGLLLGAGPLIFLVGDSPLQAPLMDARGQHVGQGQQDQP